MISAAADEVVLCVPARPEYGRIARIGAASLGLRLQMSFGAIDDLRRVMDETFVLLLDDDPGSAAGSSGESATPDGSASSAGTVDMAFRADNGAFELHAARSGGGPLSEAAIHRFDALVSGLVDDCDIDAAGASLRVRRIVKDRD